MKTPIIGLTLDWRASGNFSLYPWYAIRQNYCDSIADAGGLPIVLPFHPGMTDQYLDVIDGLLITGGDFDVDPTLYGEEVKHHRVETIHQRTQFEHVVGEQALERDLPVLGICGGHQLLNVILGGTLIQHIPAEWDKPIEHEQPNPRNEAGHGLQIETGTRLHEVLKCRETIVNSAHHQAVKVAGEGVIVNSRAPDGIIEGIEATKYKFCMGVQWHPEFIITEGDTKLFKAFVDVCR